MIRIKSSGNYVTFENKRLAFISGTVDFVVNASPIVVCAGGEQNMSLVPPFPFLIPYWLPQRITRIISLYFFPFHKRDIK